MSSFPEPVVVEPILFLGLGAVLLHTDAYGPGADEAELSVDMEADGTVAHVLLDSDDGSVVLVTELRVGEHVIFKPGMAGEGHGAPVSFFSNMKTMNPLGLTLHKGERIVVRVKNFDTGNHTITGTVMVGTTYEDEVLQRIKRTEALLEHLTHRVG